MTTTTDTVRALQDQVNAALLGSDWETLNQLVSPDARIIGPKGFMIDRDTWVGVHQESHYEQVRLQPAETEVHAYGNAGIRIDVVDSECRYKGQTITGHFRVSQVWAADRERWQLVTVQYTSIA
ncbi:MAG TPA: nuclear transport factor 2 family protein [Streptosporangiaceae bacterium]|jgi:ketosteroid isomerase-like protein